MKKLSNLKWLYTLVGLIIFVFWAHNMIMWHFLTSREHSTFTGCVSNANNIKQVLDNAITSRGQISDNYLQSSNFCEDFYTYYDSDEPCINEILQKIANSCDFSEQTSPAKPSYATVKIIDKHKYEIKVIPGHIFVSTRTEAIPGKPNTYKLLINEQTSCSFCITERTELPNRIDQNNTMKLFKKHYHDCKNGKFHECIH